MLEFLLLLLFVSLTLVTYLVFDCFTGRRNIYTRMKQYLNPDREREKLEREKGLPWRDGLAAFGKTLGRSRWGSRYKERIEIQLVQAHLPLKPEEYIAINILVLFAAASAFLILTESLAAAAAGGLLAACVPEFFVRSRKKRIIHKIDQQLPDTIALVSNTLKSGYSFIQAIDTAARELPPPISLEFRQILKEINLGENTEKALESLSKRVQSQDLELIIIAVLIQRQIGGNLSEVLDNISETIRSRIKIKGEIRILTAQGRVSGFIISFMPAALGAVLYLINPSYISVLFEYPAGLAMLILAACMQGIGIYLIRRIIRIEV
ncbi:MAG TPA: type II secretion system F family protein [Clostridia bacterium]|nr:type II secretion system F family protein [Clostridia bacterium]